MKLLLTRRFSLCCFWRAFFLLWFCFGLGLYCFAHLTVDWLIGHFVVVVALGHNGSDCLFSGILIC